RHVDPGVVTISEEPHSAINLAEEDRAAWSCEGRARGLSSSIDSTDLGSLLDPDPSLRIDDESLHIGEGIQIPEGGGHVAQRGHRIAQSHQDLLAAGPVQVGEAPDVEPVGVAEAAVAPVGLSILV